jgi:hypothetical protein
MYLRSVKHALLPVCAVMLAATVLWGCGGSEDSSNAGTAPGSALEKGATSTVSAGPSAYAWDAPESWTPQPTSPLRQANFSAGPEGQVEIYMTVLPGSGGGIAANINRWRKQMGLDDIADEAVAQLPKLEVLGGEAVHVDFEGTYTGMGDEQHAGYRMAGALLEQDGKAIFLKMVGPADAVEAEQEAFKAFAQSLRPEVAAPAPMSHAASSPGELPPGHPPIEGNSDVAPGGSAAGLPPGHPPIENNDGSSMDAGATGLPPGHPPIDGADSMGDSAGLPPGHPPMEGSTKGDLSVDRFHENADDVADLDLLNRLRWDVPEGWQRAADQPMRLVTYTMGDSGKTECYITLLPGTGGGAAMNINRWRKQMGQEELSNEEIGQLEQVEVLGRPALFAAIEGEYTGMSGPAQPDSVMLGLVSLLPGNSIFVKLIGPAEEGLAQRDKFLQFCRSLRMEPQADAEEPGTEAAAPAPDDAEDASEAPVDSGDEVSSETAPETVPEA